MTMTKYILTEHSRKVFTVTDLTRAVRAALEGSFTDIWVEGEVTGYKWHTSGHMYFSLKDASAQLACVMFRNENAGLGFELEDGMSVLCRGRVRVYQPRGQYQLTVERIEPKGVGALQIKFQQLKEKLAKEGLFAAERKRPIPYLPHCVGLVTSIDGAALRDILNILERPFPDTGVLVYPVPVQGPAAAPAIAAAIDDFNLLKCADVLILARGGGSIEDLWAFNEEAVARAIFRSEVPVISAVGHETDTTIADFVADLRAPTPSAAAELVMPLKEELLLKLLDLRRGLGRGLLGIVQIPSQRLDELKKNLGKSIEGRLAIEQSRWRALTGKLDALGPLSTLRRGFSVTLRVPDGKVITDAGSLKKGDLVKTRLSKGQFTSKVQDIA